MQRITIPEIKQHPWFLKNLPTELVEVERTNYAELESNRPTQSVEEIMRIIQDAKTPGKGSKGSGQSAAGTSDTDDIEADVEYEADASGDYVGAV